jgi:predicted small secreted protein
MARAPARRKAEPPGGAGVAPQLLPAPEAAPMRRLLLLALFGLAACNTVEGAGRDVSAGGEALSEAARDVKGALSD